MLRALSRILALLLLTTFLLPAASADILTGRDGDLIECEYQKTVTKQTRRGMEKVYVVKMEDGSMREYPIRDFGLIRKEASWVTRAKRKKWYDREAKKVDEKSWKDHEKLANRCKTRSYLDEETANHYKKAYELQKPEIKDEINSHVAFARKLERKYMMFAEAKDEWRWVYNKKKEGVTNAKGHVDLAEWCRKEGLYKEAMQEYEAALAIDPNNKKAQAGLEKLKRLLMVPVNDQMLRLVKSPMRKAMKYLKGQQNKDGSFGADIRVAGVHGHHGCAAVAGLALIGEWEFEMLDDFSKAEKPPKELVEVLKFSCENMANENKLRGPDGWGPAWRLIFLAKAYRKDGLKKYRGQIEKRVTQTNGELKGKARADGGWVYYHFVKAGTTFLTAVTTIGMLDCRDAKLPHDKGMIDKACASLMKCKQGTASWTYRIGMTREAAVGVAGRSSLCEMAMMRAGKDQGGLDKAVANFFQHRHLLAAIKGRSGTHIGAGKTAPYYYLFGHYWTTRAIKFLPQGQWARNLKKMSDVILKDQEAD
ncbi:MAG: hypothetical protein ACYTAF_13485, partial [Planctomycetota bacterium]